MTLDYLSVEGSCIFTFSEFAVSCHTRKDTYQESLKKFQRRTSAAITRATNLIFTSTTHGDLCCDDSLARLSHNKRNQIWADLIGFRVLIMSHGLIDAVVWAKRSQLQGVMHAANSCCAQMGNYESSLRHLHHKYRSLGQSTYSTSLETCPM